MWQWTSGVILESCGKTIVDYLEPLLPTFAKLFDAPVLAALTKARTKSIESSYATLSRTLGQVLAFTEGPWSLRTISDVLEADDGREVGDFLQGDVLESMRRCSAACNCLGSAAAVIFDFYGSNDFSEVTLRLKWRTLTAISTGRMSGGRRCLASKRGSPQRTGAHRETSAL